MSFVHLHTHSQYSLLESSTSSQDMAKMAFEDKMPALALTDNGNMFGAIEHYFACKDLGINPILGIDVYLAPNGRHKKERGTNTRLVLLAENFKGYQNLCKISSIGYKEGFYYKPRIDMDVLKENNENIIALTGSLYGVVPWTVSQKGEDAALQKIRELKDIFHEGLYLEICRTGLPQLESINRFLVEASKITSTPLVATNDVHYLESEDFLAQEVMICIGTNKTLQDEKRKTLGSKEFFFKKTKQMKSLFKDIPETIENTLKIADQINIEFQLKDSHGKPIYHLPSYPISKGETLKAAMKRHSEEGLELRFKEHQLCGEGVTKERKQEYFKRLEYELETIHRMGFDGYFLIVQDFIKWAKQCEIPVGPGRGSGAGSLVAYSLQITDLDPMLHGLIFERFLNPERLSMPDFDIDFCQERRHEVIEYVTQKYGEECVSQIITFGKLQARAAIRDIGRVMGMIFSEVDVVAKLIPDKLGISLKEAIQMEPRLTQLMEKKPQIHSLMELAQKIEGLVRHASIHAAGVIISNKPLVEHAPLYKGNENENVIQFDMKIAEKIGLIKFDFLGLKTLTLIKDALSLIKRNRKKEIRIQDISINDSSIYELMSRGDTAGIFQFESEGMSELISRVQPTCFNDITAINALYRPGPMQMLDEYIGRKNGKIKISYPFKELEDILKETYGIIVYQEQVQFIAAKIANYSLAEADVLRRAMSKKIAKEMKKQRSRFLEGAEENHFDRKKTENLFELMEKFAQYGFNKSHAAAYCVVAAQTAWLKAHYPVEFYAALLSTEISNTDKIVKYIKDVRAHNIEVKSPHINFSEFKFSVDSDRLFFGLGAIKGVGESAVEAILEARAEKKDNKFMSLQDFFESVDLRRVNKRAVEALIKAGAMDGFDLTRAELFNGYSYFIKYSEIKRHNREIGQTSLFSEGDEDKVEIPISKKLWTKSECLKFEKEVLGFYLSDHPLKGFESLLTSSTASVLLDSSTASVFVSIEELNKKERTLSVMVSGVVTSKRELVTRKGTRMAFVQLEDLSGSLELVLFPDIFEKYEKKLNSDEVFLVSGTFKKENQNRKLIVEEMETLEDQLVKTTKKKAYMEFRMDGELTKNISLLQSILKDHPGETKVKLSLLLDDLENIKGKRVVIGINNPEGIRPSKAFFEHLQMKLGRTDFIHLVS